MNNEKPTYFGMLPASVRYDKAVSPNAKLLYSELTVLTDKEGYCFATNEYFAGLYEVDDKTISRWVSSLKKAGHIEVEYIRRGCEVKERRIYISGLPKPSLKGQKNHPSSDEKITPSGDEKRTDNNTSINNTSITLEPRGSRPAEPPVPVGEDCDEKALHRRLREHFESTYPVYHPNKAILYWDAKCGSCTKKIITAARLTANITGEDIDRVIGDKLNLFAANFKNPDKFYSDQTYTPALLLSQWNRLTPKTESKTISLSDFMKMTPEEQEKERRENRAV